jgi:heat shock protein HtpX
LYEEISGNIWKSYLLILLALLLVAGVGYAFSLYWGNPAVVPIAIAIAVGSSVTSYYYSDRIVLGISRARPATQAEHAHFINAVEGLALAAGIPAPRTYVIDDTALNAFATGRDPQHAVICATTGLIEKLDRMELEGVIGHEMSHVKNYDIRFSTVVAVLVGVVALLSDWMMRSMRWGGGRRRRSGNGGDMMAIAGLVLAILAPFAAMAIQSAISRRREYLADANGALLTRYPPGLASALEKIAGDREPLEVANKATAHMYIANPLKDIGGRVNNLFDTHPPIEDRIRRLREM